MTNDLISRTEVLKLIYDYKENHSENRKEYPINYGTLIDMIRWVRNLPSVTPQEPQTFKWCTDCKEYDQEKHCCHRWSRVIRDTVEEVKQEPILDKLRAEIEQLPTNYIEIQRPHSVVERDVVELGAVMRIIDKYKAERTDNEKV